MSGEHRSPRYHQFQLSRSNIKVTYVGFYSTRTTNRKQHQNLTCNFQVIHNFYLQKNLTVKGRGHKSNVITCKVHHNTYSSYINVRYSTFLFSVSAQSNTVKTIHSWCAGNNISHIEHLSMHHFTCSAQTVQIHRWDKFRA